MRNFSFGRTVGLTGGLSSGTSTVSNLFRSHGIPVVDASFITDAQLNWDTAGYRAVVAAFGQQILQEIDGPIDMPRLNQIVSYDPFRRRLLYGLLAPYIRVAVLQEMFELQVIGHRLIVIDAPMLFEVEMERITDTNVVVWVDPETQIRRLMARDGISEEDATNRINAQMPLDVKRNLAHMIINNTGSLDALNEQFQRVLLEVSRPQTWTELILACLVASIFTALGIVIVMGGAILFILWNLIMN